MGIYNENGNLNDNHWMFRAARWAGSHYKLVRWTLTLLIMIVVGIILWGFANNL